MKIVLTLHVLEDKIPRLKVLGWDVTKAKIERTLRKPKWRGVTRFNQETAISLLDEEHILRVIFEREGDIIRVITIHPARRGTYESTKEN